MLENPKGFKIDFFFDSNPYFKNAILTKTYHMIDEDEPILEKSEGSLSLSSSLSFNFLYFIFLIDVPLSGQRLNGILGSV